MNEANCIIDKLESFIVNSDKKSAKKENISITTTYEYSAESLNKTQNSTKSMVNRFENFNSLQKSKSFNNLNEIYCPETNKISYDTLLKNHSMKQENIILDLNLLKEKDDKLKIDYDDKFNSDT